MNPDPEHTEEIKEVMKAKVLFGGYFTFRKRKIQNDINLVLHY